MSSSSSVVKVLLLFAVLAVCISLECDEVISKTNPFVGSGGLGYGYGSVSPAASYPQSPMRLGPDTSSSAADLGFQHFSGYFHPDKYIRMFSHTRYVGAGINGLGAVGVMPVRRTGRAFSDAAMFASELERDRKKHRGEKRLWWSDFDKETETAHAGYYKVELNEPKVVAQMVATSRLTATHYYKWQASTDTDTDGESNAVLIIDALHQSHLEDMLKGGGNATLDVSADGMSFGASYQGMGYVTYLYAELKVSGGGDGQQVTWLTCNTASAMGSSVSCGRTSAAVSSNGGGGADLDPSTSSPDLMIAALSLGAVPTNEAVEAELHVALSFVSMEQAKQNLQQQQQQPVAEAVMQVKQAWCDALSFFSFEPLDDEKPDEGFSEMLYTAASRSRMTPAIYSEGSGSDGSGGGVYTGLDAQLHNSTKEREEKYSNQQPAALEFYSDFSLWDIFRTQMPWLLLTDEPTALGILRSLGEMTTQQGGFPKWTTASVDKHVMVGVPGASMALEASFIPGMTEQFDVAAMQAALQQQATDPNFGVNGRADVDFYLKNGYVSEEEVEKASSYTLSYSVDDYILAGLSKVVGKDDDATAAAERASNYKNIFDAERMLMCPRSADGTITCAEHPQRDFDHYTEGNALHWTYFVPHDVEGLKALYPSEEAFETQLIEFFDKHLEFQRAYGNLLPNPYFWAGNEPTMLTPWLFNYGKQCHLTQYWTRTITHLHFSNKASGLPGNDDYASMSTFLLFSSLGVYPAATKDYYLIGSPRVQSASLLLQRADGSFSTLSITTHDNSADNVYVQKLLVNGLEWTSTQLPTAVLKAAEGCTLEFFMGPHASSSLCQ